MISVDEGLDPNEAIFVTKVPEAPVEEEIPDEEADNQTETPVEPDNTEETPVTDEAVEIPVEELDTPVVETPNDEVVPEAPVEDNATEESVEEEKEPLVPEDEPLKNMEKIEEMLHQAQVMVQAMEESWKASARELQLTDEHMKKLTDFNDAHKVPMPDDLTEDEKNEWDHWNGIDAMTDDDVDAIFGPDHPIHGVMLSQTIDRIKGACNDFLGWLTCLREYRSLHDAYTKLIEFQEEEQIRELQEAADKETDPDKEAELQKVIDKYNDQKYLGFLAHKLTADEINRYMKLLTDGQRIQYLIKRSMDKLDRMNISKKVILEISQFEKRFLEEKYHKCVNLVLLCFLDNCAYCKPEETNNEQRIHVVCMTMALDAVIRKTWNEEKTNKVLCNIRAFLDQLLPYIKEPTEEHQVAPPIETLLPEEVTKLADTPTDDN